MFEYEIKNRVPILLAISTCPRCLAMKEFLKNYNVDVKIVDVDLLAPGDRKAVYNFMEPINPRLSFPTLIVGDLAVIGEDYQEVKQVLVL